MPLPIIKSFAEKSGKTVKEVERLYKIAQTKAYDNFTTKNDDFYAYSIGILKNMLGIEESAVTKLDTHKKLTPPVKVVKKKKGNLSIWEIPNSWLLNMSGDAASSAIKNIIYHAESKSLFINFHTKDESENFYYFKEVPLKVFLELSKKGVSKGNYVAKNIKGKYESEKI